MSDKDSVNPLVFLSFSIVSVSNPSHVYTKIGLKCVINIEHHDEVGGQSPIHTWIATDD